MPPNEGQPCSARMPRSPIADGRPLRHVLAQARLRGEIPSTPDLAMAIDTLTAPVLDQCFIAHWETAEGYAAALVDRVLAAVAAQTPNR